MIQLLAEKQVRNLWKLYRSLKHMSFSVMLPEGLEGIDQCYPKVLGLVLHVHLVLAHDVATDTETVSSTAAFKIDSKTIIYNNK